MPPRVSIVIPAFNAAQQIIRAVDSVLLQSFLDLELIIVDDASTDDTWQTVSRLPDPRIRLRRHISNEGGGKARNTGIEAAQGEYVCFLDADDYWAPNKLEEQIKFLEGISERQNVVVYNKIVLLLDGKTRSSPVYPWDKSLPIEDYLVPADQAMQSSGLLVSRALLGKVKFDGNLRKHQDIDFIMQLERCGASFYFCPAETVYYVNERLSGRVSLNPRPELTLALLDKWGARMSPKTRSFYLATTVAPMYLRKSLPKAIWYYLLSLPGALLFPKHVAEGLLLWAGGDHVYSRARRTYRAIAGVRRLLR